MEKVIFANMCMIEDGCGRVVVQKRTGTSWNGYAFPGGHVEAGESFADAVRREVREETGLEVDNLSLCGIKDWMQEDGARYVVLLYRAGTYSGTLTSSDEGEVSWVPRASLDELETAGGFLDMVRLIETDGITEQYFRIENGDWTGEFR